MAADAPVTRPEAAPQTGTPALTGVRGFLVDTAPGGLLLLGALALVGSGPFLDALRTTRF
nr:hypothetical protein [Gordonia sp. NB41Y]